jgi:hypothetical protein
MIQNSNNQQSFAGTNSHPTTYHNQPTFSSAPSQNNTHLISSSHNPTFNIYLEADLDQQDLRNSHTSVEPHVALPNHPEQSERLFLMNMCASQDSFSMTQGLVRLAYSPVANYNSIDYVSGKSQHDICQTGISRRASPPQLIHTRSSLLDIPENARHYQYQTPLEDFNDCIYATSYQYPTAYLTCTSSSSSNYQSSFCSNKELDLEKVPQRTPPKPSDIPDDGSHLQPQSMRSRTLPQPLGFPDREVTSNQPLRIRALPRIPGLAAITIPPIPASMMGQFNYKVKGSASTQKKNICATCDKRFTRLSSLQTHTYSHTGAKRKFLLLNTWKLTY